MRSATPQLSRNVAVDTRPLQKMRAKAIISMSPRRMTAAFVLSPQRRPSQNPAPTATMFWGGGEKPGGAALHTHTAGKRAGEAGGAQAGRLAGFSRPQDPGFHSGPLRERRKQGPAPIHGANSPEDSATWTQREASARERARTEASPLKCCLYRLSFFFFF